MTHLSADRLLDLSRPASAPGAGPLPSESAHLGECAECRRALVEEQAVGRVLRGLAQPGPSATFAAAAQARFVAARRAQEVKRRVIASVAAAFATMLLILTTGTLALIAVKQIVLFTAQQLKNLAVAVELVTTLARGSALVPATMALVAASCLAMSMLVIARLSRSTSAVLAE